MRPAQQHVIISANPKSGAHSRLKLLHQLQTRLEQAGYACELFTDLNQMADRSHDLARDARLQTIVSAGGDGTASTVSSLAPQGIPITLFPTGSENLLAKYFGICSNVERCVASILTGKTRKLDTMMVGDRLSLLMASAGFDAEVVRRVHLSRRSHITRWTYWLAILRTIAVYRWPTIEVQVLDKDHSTLETFEANWVFVFNIPRYAAGLSIIDETADNDGAFDVGAFGPGGLMQGMWSYWNVLRGRHQNMKSWKRLRSSAIRMNCQRGRSSCQADGDWVGELPITVQIANRPIEFVVP